MNNTIEKLLNGEVLTEKEAKVVHIFLNNITLDIDEAYEDIMSAENALASANDKLILLELINNRMNPGMWKGILRYKYLLSYRSMPEQQDNRNIENIVKFTNPIHILNNARSVLLEKFKISVFQNRKTFNDFIETSSIDFLDEYMKSYNVICIAEPESDEDTRMKAVDNFVKTVGDNVEVKIMGVSEDNEPLTMRFASFLMRLHGANAFYKMSKGHSNIFTTFIRMQIDSHKKKHNTFKIDTKENKKHISEKYHEKIFLGKEALTDYIKSL